MSDWLELVKLRITLLVLVTAAVGFLLGSPEAIEAGRLAWTLLGVGLASSGAAALNHFVERDVDARMARTHRRPLPAGRVAPRRVLAAGVGLAAAGVASLAAIVDALTAGLALAAVVLYIAVYTPLKQRTTLNTIVGAVPGALPPVMGWTAATGSIGAGAVVLFAILFFWQLPHFLSIATMFREDYAAGGLPMLPVVDPGGATGRQVALYSIALVPVSLLPTLLGLAGPVYFFGALALGLVFVGFGLAMALGGGRGRARRMLRASLAYLPALLALLVADRTIA